MIGADSGDAEIARATVRLGDGRLKCVVMGQEFTSEPLAQPPDGKLLIKWCEAVRTFAREYEARTEARSVGRGSEAVDPNGDKERGHPDGDLRKSESADRDPVGWVRANYEATRRHLQAVQDELERAGVSYNRWRKLYEALGLDKETVNDTEVHESGRPEAEDVLPGGEDVGPDAVQRP